MGFLQHNNERAYRKFNNVANYTLVPGFTGQNARVIGRKPVKVVGGEVIVKNGEGREKRGGGARGEARLHWHYVCAGVVVVVTGGVTKP